MIERKIYENPTFIYSDKSFTDFLKTANSMLKINSSIKFNFISDKNIFLGILYYYGFIIKNIEKNQTYITFNIKKTKNIDSNIKEREYKKIIKLARTGKDGKRIYVYKFRTMQPYSEYLQDFIVEHNGLNSNGTIKNDFRITKVGKFLRRYWLDELPMLVNLFKGELKLIGVRPLSDTMLNSYPKEHVKFRNQFKPGLIPPYYVDSPKNFNELIESEDRYLRRYSKSPILTDIKYFLLFLKASLIKGIRSV